MNWRSVSFDWNQIRGFWAAAEEGSFSAASRALGLTQPTLGRQVAALEESLGVTLFERTGRRLELTQAGRDLLEHTRAMGEAAQRISLTASGASQSIEGEIRITATDLFCAHVLPPIIARLQLAAPALEIDLVAANDIRDLTRREADIAVRHVRPEQAELTAKLVSEATARPYAAKSYLVSRGRPDKPEDLTAHDFVSFGFTDEMITFLKPYATLSRKNFRVGSESGVVAWELVRRGFGVAVMDDNVARTAPEVEALLPAIEPIRFPIWLVTHRELHTSRRIRLVYDLLAEALARNTVSGGEFDPRRSHGRAACVLLKKILMAAGLKMRGNRQS